MNNYRIILEITKLKQLKPWYESTLRLSFKTMVRRSVASSFFVAYAPCFFYNQGDITTSRMILEKIIWY